MVVSVKAIVLKCNINFLLLKYYNETNKNNIKNANNAFKNQVNDQVKNHPIIWLVRTQPASRLLE